MYEEKKSISCLGRCPSTVDICDCSQVGQRTPGRFRHELGGGDHWWPFVTLLQCSLAGTFVNLSLHFILTKSGVAHRSWFSSYVLLLRDPKLRESKWHTSGPNASLQHGKEPGASGTWPRGLPTKPAVSRSRLLGRNIVEFLSLEICNVLSAPTI